MHRKKVMRIVLIVLILMLLIFSLDSLRRLALLAVFIILNLILAMGKRLVKTGLGKYLYGIEIIMFCTVITSISFGPNIGAVMGGLLMAVNYIGERRFSRYFLITLLLYTIIGYTAYFIPYDIFIVGIGATLVYNLLVNPLVMILGSNRTTMLVFSIVNILFNIFMFSTFGNLIMSLMT